MKLAANPTAINHNGAPVVAVYYLGAKIWPDTSGPVNEPLAGTATLNDDWTAESDIMIVEEIGGGLRFSTTEWDVVFQGFSPIGFTGTGKWKISWEVVSATGATGELKLFSFQDVNYDLYKSDGSLIKEPLVLGKNEFIFDEAVDTPLSGNFGEVFLSVEIEDPGGSVDFSYLKFEAI